MEQVKENSLENLNVDLLIGHVFKLWIRNRKQMLDEFKITGPQYDVLSAIYHLSDMKTEIIQMDLSEVTGIDPMTISTILRNLEKNDMITRIRGTVNTRVIYIKLTKKGKSFYDQAFSKMSSCYDNFYRHIDGKSFTGQLLVLSNELNKLK
ncbi:MAG: MarR family transcriptional regulator [Bacteroidales bacterium]|jgi:DNA-binding MarR family transcriptional regulator|nr:MarR family transcriptional regulator [Bacteroidales bacterium]